MSDRTSLGRHIADLRQRAGYPRMADARAAMLALSPPVYPGGKEPQASTMSRWEQGTISLDALADLLAYYRASAADQVRCFALVRGEE